MVIELISTIPHCFFLSYFQIDVGKWRQYPISVNAMSLFVTIDHFDLELSFNEELRLVEVRNLEGDVDVLYPVIRGQSTQIRLNHSLRGEREIQLCIWGHVSRRVDFKLTDCVHE